MNNVSSFLTVPTDNTSVTCVYTGYDKTTCYSGDSPKCFSISSSINNVDVSMMILPMYSLWTMGFTSRRVHRELLYNYPTNHVCIC
ncbi:hypothetical protein SOMG_04064 [Schizosaccharomyces osmophilus]|uniref:Uncharacterized protein n=1 Tax=Schizosaccharomyces osmophilus TaxID=2545709 RepID=A0AAE9WDV8_9SCHI|nr:uncharacterized protein SOMG_04064 [Schizosaccharomyces osmophilus]WBW73824.1 hypothetical protein SOMG_04064 [Schizosaccharomyces osmophilus]